MTSQSEFDAQWYSGYDTFREAVEAYTRAKGLPVPAWNAWKSDVAQIAAIYPDSPATAGSGPLAMKAYAAIRSEVCEAMYGSAWRTAGTPALAAAVAAGIADAADLGAVSVPAHDEEPPVTAAEASGSGGATSAESAATHQETLPPQGAAQAQQEP